MKRLTQLTASVLPILLCGLLSLGCSNSSSSGGGTTTGIVGQLTGDPDDQVDPALNQLVADAVARGENDDPLDF